MSASQQLLQAVQAPLEDLPVIDWDAALDAMSCAGPEDLPFVLELLVTFYTDSLPHVERVLAAALAFREGKVDGFSWMEGPKPDPAPRSVVRVLKEEAHAVKGSAANLRLYRIAKVAERVEMIPKKLMMDAGVGVAGDVGAALLSSGAIATLRSMCYMPAPDLCHLVDEFQALVAFVEGGELDEKLRAGGSSLAEAAEAAGSAEVTEGLRLMTAEGFQHRIRDRFRDFWNDNGNGSIGAASSSRHAAGGPGHATSAPAVAWAGPSAGEPGAGADAVAPVIAAAASRTPAKADSGATTLSRPDTADATAVDISSAGVGTAAATAGLAAAAAASSASKAGAPGSSPDGLGPGQPSQPYVQTQTQAASQSQSPPQAQTTLSHSSASVAPLPSSTVTPQKAGIQPVGAQPNPSVVAAAGSSPPTSTSTSTSTSAAAPGAPEVPPS